MCVLYLNKQGLDGALWMNVIMACTQTGGIFAYAYGQI